jgi:hypothetical protein
LSAASNPNNIFAGGANVTASGVFYFPTTALDFSNGNNTTAAASNVMLIANTIHFAGGVNIAVDPLGQPAAVLQGTPVSLVE